MRGDLGQGQVSKEMKQGPFIQKYCLEEAVRKKRGLVLKEPKERRDEARPG